MDYFLMKQAGTVSIPRCGSTDTEGPSVRIMEDVFLLERFDFLSAEALVSDRLKALLEQYIPDGDWKPCVFIEPALPAQKTFWFLPFSPYLPKRIIYGPDGAVQSMYINKEDFPGRAPGVIRISNAKGSPSVAVHLSIAESILRRGFCGLQFLRLSDCSGQV